MTDDRTDDKKGLGLRERLIEIRSKTSSPLVKRVFRTMDEISVQESTTSVIDARPETASADQRSQPSRHVKTSNRIPFAFLSYLGLVIVPFVASTIYFGFIASDQYIAEARFAVRSLSENHEADSAGGSPLSMSTMSQDGFIVTSFIHSTELLNRIDRIINYREIFSDPGIDFLSRFNRQESNERFLQYWSSQVTTFVDGPSGIITLKTRTFSPENSKRLASIIIDESEKLINELSVRAQRDMTARFADEVGRATERYESALAALQNFQNATGILTPEARASEAGSLLAGLLSKKLELDTRLFVLKESRAESSPGHQQLVLASKSLEGQIEKLRDAVAGDSSASQNIANAIKSFSQLETDRRVAESLYEVARKNLEAARAEAMRKSLYLVVFVPPTLPQESLYPHRLSSPLLILLALTVAWATLALIWASVEDHKL